VILVSFDIDGTLECGDPPGPVSLTMVRRAKQRGFVIGSASDRTLADQTRLWERHDITVDFVSNKHRLHEVAAQYGCSRHVHIGDTLIDELYATRAGFDFWFADQLPLDGAAGWIF
jgi:FMN phosphatase YigB (HAD superfamily)